MAIISFADHGGKMWAAVGSIPAASHTLTLVSNPGFIVGDPIIVEIGGEAGAGLRGTVGVGGQWPTLMYANTADMNADTSKPANTYAGITATADVYLWNGGAWVVDPIQTYYTAKIVPRALVTTITAISGNVLTLAAASVAAAASANVYFDNTPALNACFADGAGFTAGYTTPMIFKIPIGNYAVSASMLWDAMSGWTIEGDGHDETIIFSPKGCTSASIVIQSCSDVILRHFCQQGNARQNGFMLDFPTGAGVVPSTAYTAGMKFSGCNNCEWERCRSVDVFQCAFGNTFCRNNWAYWCDVVLTDALRVYVQWLYSWSDSLGGGAFECTLTSPFMTEGWETFRSNGVSFVRPRSLNGSFSSNSSGNFLFDEVDLVVTSLSQFDGNSFSVFNPMININSNISPPDASMVLGGEIRNPRIVQQGFANANGDVYGGVNIGPNNPNVKVTGTFPYGARGLFVSPNTVGDQSIHPNAGRAIVCDQGSSALVDGVRVVGTPYVGGRAIQVTEGTVKNCVCDTIGAATQANNQTNAQWASQFIVLPNPLSSDEIDALTQEIASDFSDNNTGQITAAKLRLLIQNLLAAEAS